MPFNATIVAILSSPPIDMNTWSANAVHVLWTVVTITFVDVLRIRGATPTFQKRLKFLKKIQNNAGLSPSPVVLYCATGGGKFYGYYQRAMVRQRRSVRAMHAGRQADEGAVILDGSEPDRKSVV